MKMKYLLSMIVSFYFFCLGSKLSNAAYSISLALLFLVFILVLYKKENNIKLPKVLLLAIAVLVIPLLVATALKSEWNSLLSVLKYVKYALPGVLTYYVFSDKFYKNSLACGAFGIAAVISIYSIYLFECMPKGTRIGGLGDHPNNLAFLLETLLPFMIFILFDKISSDGKKARNLSVITVMLIVSIATLFSLFVSQSRGGMASIFFGIFTVFLARFILLKINMTLLKKGFIYILINIIILSSCILVTKTVFRRSYDNERSLLIVSSYNMWKDQPLLGVGIDNWKKEYDNKYILPEAKEPYLDMPHCVPIFFFSTTGIIGGIGYLAFTALILCFLYKNMFIDPKNIYIQAMLASFIAITLHGLVDSGFTNKFIQRPFWSYFGVTLASIEYYKSMYNIKNMRRRYDEK